MNQELQVSEETEDAGAPAWVLTFADLMSLLMCFFVLLLSFSEMDVLKYKQIAGSMKNAFGVQREIKVKDIPKGTSIIAQEFSPGRPVPSPVSIKQIRQQTTDDTKRNLDIHESKSKSVPEQAAHLRKKLREEVDKGLLEIETHEREVLVRIREHGSFPSGSSRLQRSFYPVLDKIGAVLSEVEGQIVVAGHTDNVPIATKQYPSNWVLSSARAANVVHYLTQHGLVTPGRIEIRAHADTLPIASNSDTSARGKNRRVEIIVKRDGRTEPISVDRAPKP